MDKIAAKIIDGLGGTSAVAKMTMTPVSTVHSWRKNGIPRARLAHLKLAAQAQQVAIPDDLDRALADISQQAAA